MAAKRRRLVYHCTFCDSDMIAKADLFDGTAGDGPCIEIYTFARRHDRGF